MDAQIEGMVKTINRQAKTIKELVTLATSFEKDRDGWKEETIHWRNGAKEADYRRENVKLRDEVDVLTERLAIREVVHSQNHELIKLLKLAKTELESDISYLPNTTQFEVNKVLIKINKAINDYAD